MSRTNKSKSIYNGRRIVRDTSDAGTIYIMGLRNEVIYVPYRSFNNMSQAFRLECTRRNIEVRVLP